MKAKKMRRQFRRQFKQRNFEVKRQLKDESLTILKKLTLWKRIKIAWRIIINKA